MPGTRLCHCPAFWSWSDVQVCTTRVPANLGERAGERGAQMNGARRGKGFVMTDAVALPGVRDAADADRVGGGAVSELSAAVGAAAAVARRRTSPPRPRPISLPASHDGPLSPGKVLGNRYSVRKMLGKGGMGEVWRAFDLKLRVEVALKALRQDLFNDERRLEMLRHEVRAAREVVSPNVCRIFDLIEVDGTELVSMEYVDGQTLLEVLQERGPLELEGGAGHRVAVPGRAGGDPQGGSGPPRRQAREHHGHPRRAGGGDGLRAGAAGARAARARWRARRPTWRRSRRPGCRWTRGPTCTRPGWCWPRW